ncbi:uncharacterized protein LOC135385531 isoform X2 [Ornithodoros turicata]|uniref:uncharacterized protein LOC135385531 isoform X2 n=1 Tax=Ornithodoros turicata TaxID=34597 RepID=UPI003138AE70
MKYTVCLPILVVFFATCELQAVKVFEEQSIVCLDQRTWYEETRLVDSLSLCDGERDCRNNEDEKEEMCEQSMDRIDEVYVRDVQDTWARVVWNTEQYGLYTPDGFLLTLRPDSETLILRPGGDFLTEKLEGPLLQDYIVKDLLSSTNYTIILRPYKNIYTGHYKVGKAKAVSLHTAYKLLPVSTAPPGLEEVSIHCQDPIVPVTNITLTSLSLCDEVQDCFQGVDEVKEHCGNIVHQKLSAEESAVKSVTLTWSEVHPNSPWPAHVEEHRTTLYGRRTEPDGFFVTTISMGEVVTPDIKSLAGRRFVIDNLNSSTIYTFLVRPYVNSTGSRRGYKVGKLLSLSLPTKTAGLQNLTSFHVDNDTALVIWNAEVDADYFQVTYQNGHSRKQSRMLHVRSFPSSATAGMKNKLFGILVPTGIPLLRFNGVACGVQGCSYTTTMLIEDADEGDPVATITYIAATSPTSLYVNWTTVKYTDEFWVSYCEEPPTSCRVLRVPYKSLTVMGLAPATTYNIKVQPRIRTRSGSVELGLTSEAQVSTWTEVPAQLTLESYHVVTPPCLLHVAWTLYNSTVSYIQVSLEDDAWMNCTTAAHCNAHVLENEMESSTTTGSLILWNFEHYATYKVLLRGCNENGCGSNTSIDVSTPMEASSAPVNLSVEQLTHGTALVRWERPLQPRGPLDGYVVSWICDEETTREAIVTDVQFLIPESLIGQNCSASVVAYHITKRGHQLRGTEANIDFETNNTTENPGL